MATGAPPERGALAAKAAALLEAHHGPRPLLLANVWDAASARAVEASGLGFVATSSRAVAAVLGEPDDDSSDPDLVFSFLGRITRAVSVPVTADLQAGLRLRPAELVDRLLGAGAVGCNLEDSDHHGGGGLVPAERHAAYLTAVRAAADDAGVHLVLNARTDAFLRLRRDDPRRVDETVRRAAAYVEAGADCVYPMFVERAEDVGTLVASIPGPLNFLATRGLSVAELTDLGARRISLASGVFHLLQDRLGAILSTLRRGGDLSAYVDPGPERS